MELRKLIKNPLVILILYILVIFGFSGLFYINRSNFQHTTVKYESNTELLYEQIKSDLSENIKDNYYKFVNKSNEVFLDEREYYLAYPDTIIINNISINNDLLKITLSMKVDVVNSDSEGSWSYQPLILMELSGSSEPLVSDNLFGDAYSVFRMFLNVTDYNEVPNVDYNKIFFKDSDINNAVLFWMYSKHYASLKTYSETINGFPEDLDGQYLRMLYLSMVTITTLGFGDIVPLSTATRILVGIESILGIIILGLFVNSLKAKE